jgi:hypothetical protein
MVDKFKCDGCNKLVYYRLKYSDHVLSKIWDGMYCIHCFVKNMRDRDKVKSKQEVCKGEN